jgi:NAD(P)-dependent dehydrogenase (short-subunit alcohol dehydrogenase family)
LDDLSGKAAVVTGEAGGSGIGRGITDARGEAGARVVLADVEEPVLQAAVKELADAGQLAPAALSS